MNIKHGSCIVLLSSFISACGSSSSEDAGRVSEQDFDLYSSSGTWLVSVDGEFSLSHHNSRGQIEMSASLDANTVQAVNSGSGQYIGLDGCDEYGYEELLLSEVNEVDEGECDPDTQFYKYSDAHYRMVESCDGERLDVNYHKLTDQNQFDFGSLTFSSDVIENLNATNGVCAQIHKMSMIISYTDEENKTETERGLNHEIAVVAPYGDSKVVLLLDNNDVDPLTIGSYTVVPDSSESLSADSLTLELVSFEFGSPYGEAMSYQAVSGKVNISSLGDRTASGDFDVLLETGGELVGSFDIAF